MISARSGGGFTQRETTTGTTVTATSMEMTLAIEIVSARSANNWPSASLSHSTGRNIATVVIVEARSAGHTSCVPRLAATSRQFAALLQAQRVLEHDDPGIEHHADPEGEPRQGDHIEGAARKLQT